MAKTQILKAGETARIIRRVAHNMPLSFIFSARTLSGEAVAGEVKVQGSSGPFPKPATTQPLRAENEVSKGAWDTLYSVYVTPAQDTEITLNGARDSMLPMFLIAAVLIVGAAASVLVLTL